MDMTKQYSGPISAAKDFFGLKPGQELKDFAAEWKELSESSKVEITQGLKKLGYKIMQG